MLAIREALGSGRLGTPSELVESTGYRRDLAGRIAAWTATGRDPEAARPAGSIADGWEVFGRYRRMLGRLGAEDRAGLAVWASRNLAEVAHLVLGPDPCVVVHAPTSGGRPVRVVLHWLATNAVDLTVNLSWEDDPDRREVYADLGPLRDDLRTWGLEEHKHEPASDRLSGPAALGRNLFRIHPPAPITHAEGVRLVGAPRGAGVALAVAREVRRRRRKGDDPEEVLVVFPRWDDSAELVRETLAAWDLGVCGGPGRAPSADPAVSALLAALRVPIDEFDASALAHLLRHGRVRPRWPEASGRLALPSAAAAIRDLRIFRGRVTLLDALRGAGSIDPDEKDRRKVRVAARARKALPLVDRLTRLLDGLARPVPWQAQVAKVRTLASELNLAEPDGSGGLDLLLDALDDQAAVLDGLGFGRKPWRWESFVREIVSIAREVLPEADPPRPGCVRLATVAEAEGASARAVVLAGLEEGTFPARDAIDPDPAAPDPDADPGEAAAGPGARAYARELRRFLGVVDAAGASLTLIYPAANEKGQELLPAGFLDDVRRLIDGEVLATIQEESKRLAPVLPPELAVAPEEQRVLAVAEAIAGRPAALARLAADPAHRPALDGVASALRVARERVASKEFGPFDGRLDDPEVARRIAADFAPGKLAFSASQLETLAYCPFKFYFHHVLRLEPVDDREELAEDTTRRGHLIHAALDALHSNLRDAPPLDGSTLVECVRDGIEPAIEAQLDGEPEPASDVDAGLLAIEAERLRRTGRRYASQFAEYHGALAGIECHAFEVDFGKRGDGPPGLVLGEGDASVGLQGFIDRIDLVRYEGRLHFRVIDYKTGASPSPGEVAKGLALQLPLYAMAVQRLILHEQGAEPLDMAYWELKKDGFKALLTTRSLRPRQKAIPDWPAFLERMEAYVLALVDRLRKADFPVAPRADDCTRACEYRHVCRIGQIKNLDKAWPEKPILEGER